MLWCYDVMLWCYDHEMIINSKSIYCYVASEIIIIVFFIYLLEFAEVKSNRQTKYKSRK